MHRPLESENRAATGIADPIRNRFRGRNKQNLKCSSARVNTAEGAG
jgi:hypothetical protein